ncbi:MAG: WD40 repeat domain-containing protein [Chloroflexi bacterium]|nr:WD40 repeat domain-containing protein [Chloroflexota bacterium]
MLKLIFVVLALVFVTSLSYGQELICRMTCRASASISNSNIHQIRSGGLDPPAATEIRWHETDPIFVMLGHEREEITLRRELLLAKLTEEGDYFRGTNRRPPRSESFQQLELARDTIIVGTNTGRLMFWDLWTEEFLHEFQVSERPVSELLLHPSGDWLLVAIDPSRLFRFDLASQSVAEIRWPGDRGQSLQNLAISEDGYLLAAYGDGALRIWTIASWDAWEPAALSYESVADLLFTKDDSQLLVLSDATVSRWSLHGNSLHFVRQLEPADGKRECLIADGDISPDDSLLMTTDDCWQLRAWDLDTDEEIFVPQLDSASDDRPGTAILFSPDGRYFISAAYSIWEMFFIEEQL